MPTAVPGRGGLRPLTDPTFDPAGEAYPTTAYTLRKTKGPAIPPDTMGPVDAMLVIHEHPFDKLDHLGLALLLQILLKGGRTLCPPGRPHYALARGSKLREYCPPTRTTRELVRE